MAQQLQDETQDGRTRKAYVAVLDKALDILEILADEPSLGLTEISDRSGIGKTACYRILNTLEARDYVAKDPGRRKYDLGIGLMGFATQVLAQVDIVALSRPYLQRLQAETGETVNLGVLANDQVLYLDVIESAQAVRNAGHIGVRSHVHSSSLGKAWLAALEPEKAQEIIDRIDLEACTPRTITDREELLAELDRVRSRGFAVDDEEDEIGGRCVGVAVTNASGEPIAAISVAGLVATIPPRSVEDIGQKLASVARELSRELTGVRAGRANT